jgi:hypothetical protein
MTTSPFPLTLRAPLETLGVGTTRKVWYTVVFLPDAIATTLPFKQHPRLRVRGEINDVPFEGAWIPTGDGRNYLIVSPHTRKAADLSVGDTCHVRFGVDEQDRVSIPAALADLLKRDKALAKVWATLTPGKQRGYAHRVESAKAPATVTKRLDELRAELVDGVPGAMMRRDAKMKLLRSKRKIAKP